jgi:16S rRNA A1518/A1519 N6-dimethyltransferase RsmA/KsgA/DIM1 with predicted DNA glycosylase/AP lyase activity
VREVVEAAFAHRRKTAANAIAHTRIASRDEVEEALASIGHPPNARAEELLPEEFVALAEALR